MTCHRDGAPIAYYLKHRLPGLRHADLCPGWRIHMRSDLRTNPAMPIFSRICTLSLPKHQERLHQREWKRRPVMSQQRLFGGPTKSEMSDLGLDRVVGTSAELQYPAS